MTSYVVRVPNRDNPAWQAYQSDSFEDAKTFLVNALVRSIEQAGREPWLYDLLSVDAWNSHGRLIPGPYGMTAVTYWPVAGPDGTYAISRTASVTS